MKTIFFATALLFFVPTSNATDLIESAPESKMREERADGLEVYRHNLNYFISGAPNTKVQLSFKVRLIHDVDLFGAYTQTMFWELLRENSSPFSDLNYNPELFYRWYMDQGMFKGIDFGFEHRSNGRAGAESRSWNRTYVVGRTAFKTGKIETEWNTKFFYLSQIDETNSDVRYKLGFIETSLAFKNLFPNFFREAQVHLTIIPGSTWNLRNLQGSREIGFRFRLPIRSFDPFIYMQMYNGLNESLLFYKENRTTYRIGLAI